MLWIGSRCSKTPKLGQRPDVTAPGRYFWAHCAIRCFGVTASAQVERLAALLDAQAGRYKSLNGASSFRSYLDTPRPREDEEILTEPILADILEVLLGFPKDGYFPQLGRSMRPSASSERTCTANIGHCPQTLTRACATAPGITRTQTRIVLSTLFERRFGIAKGAAPRGRRLPSQLQVRRRRLACRPAAGTASARTAPCDGGSCT